MTDKLKEIIGSLKTLHLVLFEVPDYNKESIQNEPILTNLFFESH